MNSGKGIINGPVLDGLHWAAGVGTVHPSMHRLLNALGLSVFMLAGRQAGDILVGETPDGEKINRENILAPLQPLHGIFAYDRYSDNPKDRVMHLANLWGPAAAGGYGAYLGSEIFGQQLAPIIPAAKKAMISAKTLTLEQAEYASLAEQTKLFRKLSGATSVFGSSGLITLVPGPWNYGSTLGVSFLGTVSRNKVLSPIPWLNKAVSANYTGYAYGPSSMLPRLKAYLLDNPDAHAPEARKMAHAVLDPWFGAHRVTEEKVDAFLKPMLEAREKVFQTGGVPKTERGNLEKTLNGYLCGGGLEKHLHTNVKLNPAEAMIGRNGWVESFARRFGCEANLKHIQDQYHQGLIERGVLRELPKDVEAVNATARMLDRGYVTQANLAMGAMALGTAGLVYYGLSRHKQKEEEYAKAAAELQSTPNISVHVNGMAKARKPERSGGPLLITAERITDMLNAPTSLSMHRTACAAGLSIGGFIGMQVGDAIAGKTLTGKALPKSEVLDILKPLWGKYQYNAQSHAPSDRWGYVLHFGIPALFAMAGVIVGSDLFFRKRKQAIEARNDSLTDAENRATIAQATGWTPLTALGALFVTPSGFPFLPPLPPIAPQYGTVLAGRFMLGAGRKGVPPGAGEIFSGATSRYPIGPVKLLNEMLEYAAHNKDAHPEQLPEMARGIIYQWFPDASEKQIAQFVSMIEKDRARFFREGNMPPALQTACSKALAEHFKGEGLEARLRELHLDPMKATFGNSGLAGSVAKIMGVQDELDDITKEYREKYTARLKREQEKHSAPQLHHAV